MQVERKLFTLNIIILKREIFPPEADITWESFFEIAKHETASYGVVSLLSEVINIPLDGCHSCGTTAVVACCICDLVIENFLR